MKSTERTRKLRDLSVDELRTREGEMNEQMFKLRFQWAMGQTETLNKLRELRKDRARLQTIMREKSND
jgi:large subunit ribosomal protein L29